MATHEILILGGHHAGVNLAHYLLRHIVPKLSALTPEISYHVTIVTPNTTFFWNVAAPRFLVSSTLIPEEAIFLDLASAFASYDAKSFTLVNGKATALDPDKKVVTVTTNGKGTTELQYQTLVIATGSTYVEPVWQINDSEEITKAAFNEKREALKSAKTILIAGGGTVGVETAGEIGTQFPGAETTLLSGTTKLLPYLVPANSAAAEARLKALGVTTVHGVKVTSSKKEGATTTVVLSDGTEKTVDVFIDATGRKPNTSFLPKSWLDSTSRVAVDDKTMRSPIPGVYALGDVASFSDGSIMGTGNSVAPTGSSIGIDIAKKEGVFAQKQYSAFKDTQFVPTGPSGGVGQVMGWKVPSFMVWLVKSRGFFVGMAKGAVEGANVKKA